MTIQQAAAEIMRQSEAKADYLVNTENLHMETCDGIPVLRLLDESGTGPGGTAGHPAHRPPADERLPEHPLEVL